MGVLGNAGTKILERNLNKNMIGVLAVAKEAVKEILETPEWQKKLHEAILEETNNTKKELKENEKNNTLPN